MGVEPTNHRWRQSLRRWSAPVGWSALSQIASSATNFLLHVALLLSVDSDRFGRLVAVLACYQLALTASRSLISEPLVAALGVSDHSNPDDPRVSAVGRRARIRLGGLGILGLAATFVLGWQLDLENSILVVLAMALPVLLYQDGLRHWAWGLGRPAAAVALDGWWLAVALIAFVGLQLAGVGSNGVSSLWAWIGGGLMSVVVGLVLLPRLGGAASDGANPAEFGESSNQLDRLGQSHAIQNVAFSLLPILVALIVSPSAAGLLKAGLLPFTPVLTIFAGARLVSLPAMNRIASNAGIAETTDEADDVATDYSARAALDRATEQLLLVAGTVSLVASLAVVGAVALLRPFLPGSIPAMSVLLWAAVGGVCSIVVKILVDGLAFGRRDADVVGRRLWAVAVEWAVVLGASLLVSEHSVVAGWTVGTAIGAVIWLIPTLDFGSRRTPNAVG